MDDGLRLTGCDGIRSRFPFSRKGCVELGKDRSAGLGGIPMAPVGASQRCTTLLVGSTGV